MVDVLAVIRFLLAFFNKEHVIFSRYDREHPHFKWFLGLDAVLSTVLVFGGVAFAFQGLHDEQTVQLEHSGGVVMSSTELIEHVKSENIGFYWLGPILGDKYTIDHTVDNEIVIVYLAKDSDINNANKSKLIIDTYANSASVEAPDRSKSWTEVTKQMTALGNTVEFDKNSMMEEKVAIKGTDKIVLIHYPTVQTSQTMMENADALKQVS